MPVLSQSTAESVQRCVQRESAFTTLAQLFTIDKTVCLIRQCIVPLKCSRASIQSGIQNVCEVITTFPIFFCIHIRDQKSSQGNPMSLLFVLSFQRPIALLHYASSANQIAPSESRDPMQSESFLLVIFSCFYHFIFSLFRQKKSSERHYPKRRLQNWLLKPDLI